MGDTEKEIIKKVKIYLKYIRELRIYRDDLIEEINDYSLKAVDLSAVHTENKTYDTTHILNKRISKKDRSISIINEINNILDEFYIATLFLLGKERRIVNTFIDSNGYTEMIYNLEDKVQITESTYCRKLPHICLELSQYIDYSNPPTVKKIINKLKESEIVNNG